MQTEITPTRPRPDWLPRSIISGFISTITMAILFFVAYGLAQVATLVQLSPNRGASEFTRWLHALTSNQVLDVATDSLYLAAALHLVVGVLWAMVYAYWFEPRFAGQEWLKGLTFAVIPWALSLVIFLPLVGGGFFGEAIGAGPLPAIGNLILHLAYGATLGAIYGPLGDIPADELSRKAPQDSIELMTNYEQAAARGIAVGAGVGMFAGIAGAAFASVGPAPGMFGPTPIMVVPVAIATGAVLGGLWGSLAGLSGATRRPA